MKRHEVGSFVVRQMDGTGVWHTEWSKPEREKQTSYINAYIKNLKKLTNDVWYCFKEWLRVNLKREKFEFSMLATFHSTKEPPASAVRVQGSWVLSWVRCHKKQRSLWLGGSLFRRHRRVSLDASSALLLAPCCRKPGLWKQQRKVS